MRACRHGLTTSGLRHPSTRRILRLDPTPATINSSPASPRAESCQIQVTPAQVRYVQEKTLFEYTLQIIPDREIES